MVIHTQGSRKFSFEFKSRASSKNATMGSELLLNKRPSSSFLDPPDREADQPVKLKIVSKLYLRSTGLSSKAASKLFFLRHRRTKLKRSDGGRIKRCPWLQNCLIEPEFQSFEPLTNNSHLLTSAVTCPTGTLIDHFAHNGSH